MKWLLVLVVAAVTVMAEEEAADKKDELGTVIGIDLGTTYSW